MEKYVPPPPGFPQWALKAHIGAEYPWKEQIPKWGLAAQELLSDPWPVPDHAQAMLAFNLSAGLAIKMRRRGGPTLLRMEFDAMDEGWRNDFALRYALSWAKFERVYHREPEDLKALADTFDFLAKGLDLEELAPSWLGPRRTPMELPSALRWRAERSALSEASAEAPSKRAQGL